MRDHNPLFWSDIARYVKEAACRALDSGENGLLPTISNVRESASATGPNTGNCFTIKHLNAVEPRTQPFETYPDMSSYYLELGLKGGHSLMRLT